MIFIVTAVIVVGAIVASATEAVNGALVTIAQE
jgi:hypothetical protein